MGCGLNITISLENGIGLIKDNSRESIWVGDDEFLVCLDVDFTWRMGVGSCIGMRFDGKDATSSKREQHRDEEPWHVDETS